MEDEVVPEGDSRLYQWMICQEPEYGNDAWKPNPKRLYNSESQARHAAEKLCRENNHTYFLLKVVDVVQLNTPPISWLVGE